MKRKLLILFLGRYLNLLSRLSPRQAGRLGFLIFCHPQRRAVKPHHLEFLNTGERFTITHASRTVVGYRWGNGPRKVLLCHGWESHSYWWKNVVNGLSKEKFTIIAIDAPAHGLSEGKYLNAVIYSGLIEKLALHFGGLDAILGHSLGALSAVYTLFRVRDLPVAKLVVMAAPGEVKQFLNYYQQVLGLSDRTMKAVLDHFAAQMSHTPDFFSLQKFAAHVTIPGLIIHDLEDREAPYAFALAAHQAWPQSKMITTKGLGHNLKSLELIDEVKAFLG